MKISQIIGLNGTNHSRITAGEYESADQRAALATLLYEGFTPGLDRVQVAKLTKEQQAAAVEQRQADYDSIAAATTVRIGDRLRPEISVIEQQAAYKALYQGKSGKWITPTHGVISGFRRTGAISLVNAVRAKLDHADGPIEDLDVLDWGELSEQEWVHQNLLPNTKRMEGARKLTREDECLAAIAMARLNATQSKIRRTYGAGNGQLYYWVAMAELNFPELKIEERITDGSLRVGSLAYKEVKKAVDASDPAMMAAHMADPKAGKATTKAPAKADLQAAQTACPSQLVKTILGACLNRDETPFLAALNNPEVARAIDAAAASVLPATPADAA